MPEPYAGSYWAMLGAGEDGNNNCDTERISVSSVMLINRETSRSKLGSMLGAGEGDNWESEDRLHKEEGVSDCWIMLGAGEVGNNNFE